MKMGQKLKEQICSYVILLGANVLKAVASCTFATVNFDIQNLTLQGFDTRRDLSATFVIQLTFCLSSDSVKDPAHKWMATN